MEGTLQREYTAFLPGGPERPGSLLDHVLGQVFKNEGDCGPSYFPLT